MLMAELATDPTRRNVLESGRTAVSQEMIDHLEAQIDELDERFDPPTEFVVPGGNVTAAWPSHPAPSSAAPTAARSRRPSAPDQGDVVGYAGGAKGTVPRQVGLDRATLTAAGFEGKVGQTLIVPGKEGRWSSRRDR